VLKLNSSDVDEFVATYGDKVKGLVDNYPKSVNYYIKLWKYKHEQKLRSNALVAREPG
jgi:hypothetical protein